MQTAVNGLSMATYYETRNTSAADKYYTNSCFPNSGIVPLTYSYFDDYDLDQDGTANYGYSNKSLPGEAGATTAQVKGMPTMLLKSTVGSGMAAVWLITVQFYDHNLRPIQTQANNLLNYTANAVTDFSTTVPNFIGLATVSQTVKVTGSGAGGTTTVLTTPTYDHVQRITGVSQRYNGNAPIQVAAYTYSEAGQMISKGLGVGSGTADITNTTAYGSTSVTALTATNSITLAAGTYGFSVASGGVFSASIAPAYQQLIDYRYNIRGQLLSINNSKLTADGGVTQDDPNAVFGMQLLYDGADSNLGTTGYFDGKISAVKWMTRDGSNAKGNERAYTYNYDVVNRYTAANYAERATTGTSAFSFTHGWDEAGITYDENGNIKSLSRNATTQGSGTYSAIDALTYTYRAGNANQLDQVTDATNVQTGFGIYAGGNASGHYGYDANGNLTDDPFKNLHTDFNMINRTDKINMLAVSGQNIQYVYDAGGSLLRKIANSGTATTTTDYLDGFVFVNSSLSYFSMPEGRIVNNGANLAPEYIITDQQGNARVSINQTGAGNSARVIQENSYYGFGMTMPGSAVSLPSVPNKQLYNGGSELQNDFAGLPNLMQTFFRNYDAALGRWTGADPQAEGAESMSTYQYVGNNPIMYNDALGNKAQAVDYSNINAITLQLTYNMYSQIDVNGQSLADIVFGDGIFAGGAAAGGSGGDGGGGNYNAFSGTSIADLIGTLSDLNSYLRDINSSDPNRSASAHLTSSGDISFSFSTEDIFGAGAAYLTANNAWGQNGIPTLGAALNDYNYSRPSGSRALSVSMFDSSYSGNLLREVPIVSTPINKSTGEGADGNGKGFEISDALDKSLNLTSDMLVLSQRLGGIEWKNMVREVPVLKQLGIATGMAGFINHAINFGKKANWKDGLEMAGQAGIWGLKIAFPESYVIDAVEFGYNNGTMIFDTIWDHNHK